MDSNRSSPAKPGFPITQPTGAMRQEPLTTEQLFGKRQEIVIVHDGEAYRLRITRNNKLILTK